MTVSTFRILHLEDCHHCRFALAQVIIDPRVLLHHVRFSWDQSPWNLHHSTSGLHSPLTSFFSLHWIRIPHPHDRYRLRSFQSCY